MIYLRFNNLTIILLMLFSNQIFSQHHNHHFNLAGRKTDLSKYFSLAKIPQKISEDDLIKMDSIVTLSTQGNSLKLLFEYNQIGKISEQLELLNIGSGWDKSTKFEFIYDEDGDLISEVLYGWNVNKWDSLYRITYTYNQEGKLYHYVFQSFYENDWLNISQTNYEYHANGNVKTINDKSWEDNKWNNDLLIEYFYSFANRRDSILLSTWYIDNWRKETKTIFYDNEGIDSVVAKRWSGYTWTNYFKRITAYYLDYNRIEQMDQLDQFWISNKWQNSLRRFFNLNQEHYVTNAYCEIWDDNSWKEGEGDIIIENPDGFRAAFITNTLSIYYSTITDIPSTEPGFPSYNLFQNYPNPFNPATNIEFQIGTTGFVSLKVFDLLGNEVAILVNEYKTEGTYRIKFNAKDFASGIYYYQITAGDFVSSKKLILMK